MSETETNQNANRAEQPGIQNALNYMLERKIDTLLWLTRLGTIAFTFLTLIPLFGVNPHATYQRALMSSAATSALRLHQRMPNVQITLEFGARLIIEDSCHYLLYSILFIYSYPVTLALFPVFLFAILHSMNYSITVLNKLGQYNTWATRQLTSIAANHQHKILKFVALTEVILMPMLFLLLLSGKRSLFTLFFYYKFLTLRWASRRNPYTRNMFREMRIILENFANTPGRNAILKNMCHKLISYTSYFAPRVQG